MEEFGELHWYAHSRTSSRIQDGENFYAATSTTENGSTYVYTWTMLMLLAYIVLIMSGRQYTSMGQLVMTCRSI